MLAKLRLLHYLFHSVLINAISKIISKSVNYLEPYSRSFIPDTRMNPSNNLE